MASRFNTTFDLSDVELGILSFLNVIFSVGGSFGNIIVCLAFLMYESLRNTMNIFIFSLACSDLLVCLIAQPMFVASLVNNYQQELVSNAFEDVRKRLTWISLLASAGNLLGVTLDRYVAISQPLTYLAKVTTKRACIFVAVVWAVSISFGTATEPYPQMKVIGQIYVFFLLICLIFPLYCHVLCIARKHARVIGLQTALSHSIRLDQNSEAANCSRRLSVRKADRNSLKTVGIISSIFVIGWFPLLILPFLYRSEGLDRKILLDIFQWVNTLAMCSSACNPVVYSLRDRRIRGVLSNIYSRWTDKRTITLQNSVKPENTNILSKSTPT